MNNQKNMMFTKKAIVAIIVPLILQSILSVTIGMVDSMMVSNKGEDAFAGVSLVGTLDTLLITLFSALTSGGSVVLAQAMGRGDKEKACDAAKQLLYAASATAAFISTVVILKSKTTICSIIFVYFNFTLYPKTCSILSFWPKGKRNIVYGI